jgi:hypothetical protein
LAGGYLFKSAHGLHYHFKHISHSSFSISVPPTTHSSPLCLLTRTELITGDTSYLLHPALPPLSARLSFLRVDVLFL